MKVSSLGIVVVAFLTTGALVEIAKTGRETTCSLFSGRSDLPEAVTDVIIDSGGP